jgi:hypothetical protein
MRIEATAMGPRVSSLVHRPLPSHEIGPSLPTIMTTIERSCLSSARRLYLLTVNSQSAKEGTIRSMTLKLLLSTLELHV